ncbi:Fusicoccadiene synthase [Penicillium chrysogenum]|uniref:Fusicoccadiene synthase n=1 Tax=Penicillium chrysogenum TaxID=5076 RepID=A0A167S196_PENCH|nr:Fusicoccadiene synthase [Penicillium chrysogenum]
MADKITDEYAVGIDPEIYANNPAYSSLFNPYIHKQTIIADHVSVQCHIDLNGIDAVGSKFGNLNAHAGNFTSLCAPNCLPERFALVAYTVEYAFLHDDETDNAADQEALLLENKMLHQALNQSGMTSVSTRVSDKAQRKSEVQAKIAAEYLRLDPVFGEWFLNKWQTFTACVKDVRSLEFPSLDDYLEFRIVDAAADWTLYNFRWGSGITLTPEEEKIADPMSYVAYAELCLVNDLFSWDKEYASHIKSNGDVPLVNAVHIVAVTQGLTHCAAKAVVQAEVRAHEERFCQLKEQYEATDKPSHEVLRWLRLLEHSMAGNWVWSLCVPRYCKVDRNPYKDHLEKYGSDAVRVLTPLDRLCWPKQEIKDMKQSELKDPSSTTESDVLARYTPGYPSIDEESSYPQEQTLIAALNSWYKVPVKSLLIIEGAVNFLHNSSLLLDDIQDGSFLRRGRPVAHQIFGVGQTINTATYLMNEALYLIQMLSPSAVSVYTDEMRNLQLGQGRDLYWSYHTHVPTPAQYISMVDGKTGGLFRLISRLMRSEATKNSDLDISQFATLLGRHFQIRDDYQNLQSEDYTKNKGFCDDLDEGKLSFPIILSMQSPGFSNTALSSVFKGSQKGQTLSLEMKQYMLEEITARGAFSETKAVLRKLHTELLRLLIETEKKAGGVENWALRLLIMKLDIAEEKKVAPPKSDSHWGVNQRRAWKGCQKNGRPIDKACFLRAMEETLQK